MSGCILPLGTRNEMTLQMRCQVKCFTYTDIDKQAQTQSLPGFHTQIHTYRYTHDPTRSLSLTHTYTHSHTYTNTHTHTHRVLLLQRATPNPYHIGTHISHGTLLLLWRFFESGYMSACACLVSRKYPLMVCSFISKFREFFVIELQVDNYQFSQNSMLQSRE